jgi:hypothetical protein
LTLYRHAESEDELFDSFRVLGPTAHELMNRESFTSLTSPGLDLLTRALVPLPRPWFAQALARTDARVSERTSLTPDDFTVLRLDSFNPGKSTVERQENLAAKIRGVPGSIAGQARPERCTDELWDTVEFQLTGWWEDDVVELPDHVMPYRNAIFVEERIPQHSWDKRVWWLPSPKFRFRDSACDSAARAFELLGFRSRARVLREACALARCEISDETSSRKATRHLYSEWPSAVAQDTRSVKEAMTRRVFVDFTLYREVYEELVSLGHGY